MLGHGDMTFIAPKNNFPSGYMGRLSKTMKLNRVTDAGEKRGTPDYIDSS